MSLRPMYIWWFHNELVSWSLTSLFSTNMAISETRFHNDMGQFKYLQNFQMAVLAYVLCVCVCRWCMWMQFVSGVTVTTKDSYLH